MKWVFLAEKSTFQEQYSKNTVLLNKKLNTCKSSDPEMEIKKQVRVRQTRITDNET